MTTYFSDNFESGDLTAWTTVVGNPEVQSTLKRTGEYACASTIVSGSRSNSFTKAITAQTSIYLRFYVYFSALPSGISEVLITRCSFNGSRPLVTVYKDNTSYHWRLRDGAGTIRQSTIGPETQTWYCIELKAVAEDESALYVNGEMVLSGTAPSGSSTSIVLSAHTYSGVADGTTVAFDDIAYSDTYNGPQNLTQILADALSTDDLQLCNKQFLTSDNFSVAETTLGNKSVDITDYVTNPDYIAAFKQLIVDESLNLSEAIQAGARRHVKTKLLFFFDDLAVQLTGD